MQIEPNDLLLFATVVKEGSFSRAAQRLGIPTSTVSRHIAELETALGERLLLRTTRKLTVTDFGLAVLEHARQLAEATEAAAAFAGNRQVEPSGRLRVSLPTDFAKLMLGSFLSEFVSKYPAITLDVDFSMRLVDLIGENFDVAVRGGPLPSDATLAARRVGEFTLALYAAPAYLKRRGTPGEPGALMDHDVLQLSRNGEAFPLVLHHGAERWRGAPRSRAIANSPELLLTMAVDGLGISALADRTAEPYVEKGKLVRILPKWHGPHLVVHALFPGRRLMPARTRVFIDMLVAKFSTAPTTSFPRTAKATAVV